MDPHERRAWLRLTLDPRVPPRRILDLLAAFGLPQAVLDAGHRAIARVAGDDVAEALLGQDRAEAVAQAESWCGQGGGRSLLVLADPDYPPALLELSDPPALLYLHGRRALLASVGLAMVGSRNATRQGEVNAEMFAAYLGACDICTISGLARGIDAAAHRGALRTPASTIAVLGCGIDVVYPDCNRQLAQRIAAEGLLLSEYPIGTGAIDYHFPRRNRLIAALSRGVLVVEAALRSGSLITARLAAELGREVMAIPGSIHSPVSRGCHRLIRDGARLVESAQDVLEELRIDAHGAPPPRSTRSDAEHEADPLMHALGHDPVDLDTLGQRSGLQPGTLAARLLDLEMAQYIERLPGNRYQRLRRS